MSGGETQTSMCIYVMYNELCEYKDTEWNITYYCLTITVYLIQLCTGGATSPTSPPPDVDCCQSHRGLHIYIYIYSPMFRCLENVYIYLDDSYQTHTHIYYMYIYVLYNNIYWGVCVYIYI